MRQKLYQTTFVKVHNQDHTNTSSIYFFIQNVFISIPFFISVNEERRQAKFVDVGGELKERACDSLMMCIVTTMNQGLRNGGGIGDILRAPSSNVSIYQKLE